jgi:hypothetical protein
MHGLMKASLYMYGSNSNYLTALIQFVVSFRPDLTHLQFFTTTTEAVKSREGQFVYGSNLNYLTALIQFVVSFRTDLTHLQFFTTTTEAVASIGFTIQVISLPSMASLVIRRTMNKIISSASRRGQHFKWPCPI